MTPQEIGPLVSLIGLLCQLATDILLAILFALLCRTNRGRAYFRYWSWSWVVLSFGLVALLYRFLISDGGTFATGRYSLQEHLLAAIYQASRISCLMLLLFGCLNYYNRFKARPWMAPALGFAIAFAAAAFLATSTLVGVMIWQSLANAAAYTACAILLFKVTAARGIGGARVTAIVFALLGAFWAVCFAIPFLLARFADSAVGDALWQLVLYNGFVDLFLQMLLAFGMVLILSEENRRELEQVHAELKLAHLDLKEESVRDSLTRALNRRALAEDTGPQTLLAHKGASAGAVMIFDLDNLKLINDQHGHRTGDALLKHFVETLEAQLRESDRLYRYGGDEFLLVMPRAHPDEVVERYQRFFETVPGLQTPGNGLQLPLEVSLGAAAYTAENFEAAVAAADRQMYANKRQRKRHLPQAEPQSTVFGSPSSPT